MLHEKGQTFGKTKRHIFQNVSNFNKYRFGSPLIFICTQTQTPSVSIDTSYVLYRGCVLKTISRVSHVKMNTIGAERCCIFC